MRTVVEPRLVMAPEDAWIWGALLSINFASPTGGEVLLEENWVVTLDGPRLPLAPEPLVAFGAFELAEVENQDLTILADEIFLRRGLNVPGLGAASPTLAAHLRARVLAEHVVCDEF